MDKMDKLTKALNVFEAAKKAANKATQDYTARQISSVDLQIAFDAAGDAWITLHKLEIDANVTLFARH